jgi:hypothetical protein
MRFKSICKTTLLLCLSAVAAASIAADFNDKSEITTEKVKLSDDRRHDFVYLYQIEQKYSKKSSAVVFVKAANSDKEIKNEKEMHGFSPSFMDRKRAVEQAIVALNEDPPSEIQQRITITSEAGKTNNFANSSPSFCEVHVDPKRSEIYALIASKIGGINFDSVLMERLMARHELSHCMYSLRHSKADGLMYFASPEMVVDIFGLNNNEALEFRKYIDGNKEALKMIDAQTNETYADIQMIMGAAQRDWTNNWGKMTSVFGETRTYLAKNSDDKVHDSAIAIDVLTGIGIGGIKLLSADERDCLADNLAIYSAVKTLAQDGYFNKKIESLFMGNKKFSIAAGKAKNQP